jgi:ribose transport system ATP-binding protein
MSAAPLLEVHDAVKSFGATRALDGLDFAVRAGEIHALLGANGAGKSTLIKALAGLYRLDAGQIKFAGESLVPDGQPGGIAFIHQDLALIDSLTVAENIGFIAGFERSAKLIAWSRTRRRARAALRTLGHDQDIAPEALVSSLSRAQKSIVAIARALAVPGTRLLVLDEPTASLPEREVGRVFASLRALRESGVAMVYVTHRLDEVFRIAERVTVMRDGRRVLEAATSDIDAERLVNEIVGRPPGAIFERPRSSQSADGSASPRLRVSGLEGVSVGPVSFDVGPGETVALVGLEGAGQASVGRMLFGDEPILGGSVEIDGSPSRCASPREAIANGIGFISSKRAEENLAETLSVRENLFLNPWVSAPQQAWLAPRDERARAADLITTFLVRTGGTEVPISTLSGGNQQKVVLARWLSGARRLLVLEEPTIGVDVGAKAEIYRLLGVALESGAAVLLISTDFEEVAGIASRALAFSRGRIVAELTPPRLTVDELTHAAMRGRTNGDGAHAF